MRRGEKIARIGVLVLAVGTMIGAGFAKREKDRKAEIRSTSTVVTSVDLRFEDRQDGSIGVMAGIDSREVAVISPRTNGFVRGVLRGLFRTRKRAVLDRSTPFRLSRFSDGHHELRDLAVGETIDLSSFGPDNEGAFAKFLTAADVDARHARR